MTAVSRVLPFLRTRRMNQVGSAAAAVDERIDVAHGTTRRGRLDCRDGRGAAARGSGVCNNLEGGHAGAPREAAARASSWPCRGLGHRTATRRLRFVDFVLVERTRGVRFA